MLAELVPFGALRFDQPLEDVIAEGVTHDSIAFISVDRLAQRRGQGGDVAALQILVGEVVEVFLDRLRQRQLALDAVDARPPA